MIRKMISSVALFAVLICSGSYANDINKPHTLDDSDIKKHINTSVQLKENKWIKITNEYYWEETVEEFEKRMGLEGVSSNKNMIFRTVAVWVQFLKPCKATSKYDDIKAEYPDGITPNEAKARKLFALENLTLRYKCDYRTKVFVTFFSSDGVEIETSGEQPMAMTDEDGFKLEILPGEKTLLIFTVSKGATSWYSWVSK